MKGDKIDAKTANSLIIGDRIIIARPPDDSIIVVGFPPVLPLRNSRFITNKSQIIRLQTYTPHFFENKNAKTSRRSYKEKNSVRLDLVSLINYLLGLSLKRRNILL
jgi:ribosomal protein L35